MLRLFVAGQPPPKLFQLIKRVLSVHNGNPASASDLSASIAICRSRCTTLDAAMSRGR